MKIYKKKELPRHEEEEFSVIVLTEKPILGFITLTRKIGVFFRKLTKVIETLNLYGYTHQPIR